MQLEWLVVTRWPDNQKGQHDMFPLSLSPSFVTREKTHERKPREKNGLANSWGREAHERRRKRPIIAVNGRTWFFLSRFSWVRAFTQRNYHHGKTAKLKAEIATEINRKNNGEIGTNSWDNLGTPNNGHRCHISRFKNWQQGLGSNFRMKIIEVVLSDFHILKARSVSVNLRFYHCPPQDI